MSIYLKWRDSAIGSKDRFVSNLFSYLSPRWYPVNIIGSTVYDFFSMYGDQFVSVSVELEQVYDDLFLNTVRTSPAVNSYSSKMYNNFGVLLGVDKLWDQDYNYFNTGSVLQSYRQELRLLTEAFLAGNTEEGLARIGHAYTGMAPIIIQPSEFYTRWNLSTYTGSIQSIGNGFVLLDKDIPGIGYLVSTADPFAIGDSYAVSWSNLGINTIIYDEERFYSSADIYFYSTSGSFSNSFKSSIENSVKKVVGAGTIYNIFYLSDFAYYRPQVSTGAVVLNTFLSLSESGFLYNSSPAAGVGFTGSVIGMPPSYYDRISFYDDSAFYDYVPSDYSSLRSYYDEASFYDDNAFYDYVSADYYYDWLVLTRNDAYYKFSIRTYPSQSIPSTVYFKEYNPNRIDYLSFISGSIGSHWIFNQPSILWDISGNRNNLMRVTSRGSEPSYMLAREESRTGLITSDSMYYTGSIGSSMNLTDSFYCEMWIRGIDKTVLNTSGAVIVKRQDGIDYTDTLTANGYLFGINILTQQMALSIRNSSTFTASASIANYLQEDSSRYHCFGYTYISGSIFLYIDGKQVSYVTGAVVPANLSTNMFTTFYASGSNIGMDEVVVSQGFLTPELALQHFNDTKPRIKRLGFIGESANRYHQPQITIYALGSNEIEFHQFSIRAFRKSTPYIFDARVSDILRVPIFKTIGIV